jgi:photosystem II stability/assembly factor-like uncharacterized protein
VATRQARKKRLREARLARQQEAERARFRHRRAGIALGCLLAAVAVAGVAVALTSGGQPRGGGGESTPAAIVDVHGIGVNPADGSLYIATHTGLFRSASGESSARRVDAPEQDLMGFSIAGPDRFVASGHPGPGQDLPPAIGLIESRDDGRSWESLSLKGEADFHVLRAAGRAVYGFDGRLMASSDGGRTWQEREAPADLVDLAPDPRDPDRVLASTGGGLRISEDGGRSWSDGTLGSPALLAWGGGARVFAVDGQGKVYASGDGGGSWRQAGTVRGPPAAFTADERGKVYLARPDGSVDESADGGRNWRPRSRN